MSVADAMAYWMSATVPNDQFAVYCFAHVGRDSEAGDLLEIRGKQLLRRTETIYDLSVRVLPVPAHLDRPYWVGFAPTRQQIITHPEVSSWAECLDRIGELGIRQLTPSSAAWRIHLFGPVAGLPGGAAAVVVVLQVSHALGDGRRVAQIARELFGPEPAFDASARPIGHPELVAGLLAVRGAARLPWQLAATVGRGVHAYREYRRGLPKHRDDGGVPTSVLNRPAGPSRSMRVLVVDRRDLPHRHSVTVGAMTAISWALQRYLGQTGGLAAELTVARENGARGHGTRGHGTRTGREPTNVGRNNFRNVGIDLHADIASLSQRATAIEAEIARARHADHETGRSAAARAAAGTPPVLSHWGARQFDADIRPERVTGVTVVSSVYRGPADLTLDGDPVLLTTGFPALSPAQGLTHGVHGIGDTVALSVTTSPEVIPDVDRYVELLEEAIKQVGA